MAEPTTKAQVHGIFTKAVQALQRQARDISEAAKSPSQTRPWQVPPASAWDGDLTAVDQLEKAFDRAEIEENHAEVIGDLESPGTAGDVISLKLQNDYVAAMERAFRARHATPVRCMAHAAGRRAGHGHSAGIFSDTSGALRFATDIKMIGDSEPVEQ